MVTETSFRETSQWRRNSESFIWKTKQEHMQKYCSMEQFWLSSVCRTENGRTERCSSWI